MQVSKDEGYANVVEEKTTVDFPFDLNNLFSMQYSFDQLKMAIEYLAKQQGDQQVLINELLRREPGAEVRIIDKKSQESNRSGGKSHIITSADPVSNTGDQDGGLHPM